MIVWQRPDGGISISTNYIPQVFEHLDEDGNVVLVQETPPTEQEWAAYIQARGDIPADWVPVQFGAVDVPEDRSFRNAWRMSGGKITVDVAAAQEVTKDRLRAERGALLAELDVQFIQALERGETTTAIVAEKKRLRDLPETVDSIRDLDALKTLTAAPSRG